MAEYPHFAATNVLHDLPLAAGLGLKQQHVQQVLASRAKMGFFEVHAENYMVAGGRFHHDLTAIRENYALSMHGVGLSIGGQAPLDQAHLQRLRLLLERYEPQVFSEHLAWGGHGGVFFNDLLPLPYTYGRLQQVCAHIDQVQNTLRRRILLENPSTYLRYTHNDFEEPEFLTEIVRRTGCHLLLDVNNVYVSCVNHGEDAWQYLQRLPRQAVAQIHLAGFAEDVDAAGDRLLIDHHGAPVAEAVWQLYARTLHWLGRAVPTLIERDNAVPPWEVLLAEAQMAQTLIDAMPTPGAVTQASRDEVPS